MNKQLNSKKYWDDVAYDKEFTTPFQIDLFSEYVNKNAHILDVGCGYGRVLNKLSSRGYQNLYGIDISEKMIERAAENHPSLNVKVKKDEKIDFEDNYFDAVIVLAVLTCIIKDEEQQKFINEIKRVLKPGGVIYINDFLLNADERNIKRYNRFKGKYNKYGVFELSEGTKFRHHKLDWIKNLTNSFKEILLEEVTYTTMNGNKSNGFYYMGENKK